MRLCFFNFLITLITFNNILKLKIAFEVLLTKRTRLVLFFPERTFRSGRGDESVNWSEWPIVFKSGFFYFLCLDPKKLLNYLQRVDDSEKQMLSNHF